MGGGAGAIDTAQFWPSFVKERVRATFLTFGGGLAMTAAQCYALHRSGLSYRIASASPLLSLGVSIAAMFGSQMLLHSVSYENKMGKFLAYSVFTGVTASVIAPIAFLGGQIIY